MRSANGGKVIGVSVHILLGERSKPHTGVFNRDFACYMCRFVCLGMPKCVGGITWPKNAHAQSQVLGG